MARNVKIKQSTSVLRGISAEAWALAKFRESLQVNKDSCARKNKEKGMSVKFI